MRFAPLSLTLLGLAACNGSPETGDATPTATSEQDTIMPERAPGGQAIGSVDEMVGEYSVVGIDDEAVEGSRPIALSFDGQYMRFGPKCLQLMWEVHTTADGLSFTQHDPIPPAVDLEPGEVAPPPPARCALGMLPEWERLQTALDSITRAERMPDGNIRLSGGGRSALLTR